MSELRVRFHFYSVARMNSINVHFLWIGKRLEIFFYNLKYDLEKAELHVPVRNYLTASFFSAAIYGILFFIVFFLILNLRQLLAFNQIAVLSMVIGLAFAILFFSLHILYPGIVARKVASSIDQSLLFALTSLLMQINSGVSLFNALSNIARANYGLVSEEFKGLIKEISSGTSELKALEKLAVKTRSEYLKKTIWQILNSMKSGASLTVALNTVLSTLRNFQSRAIKDYAGELNLLVLMYLLVAAAIPTIGITFMVIISSFGGSSITEIHVAAAVMGSFALQFALIGFIKSRIPKVLS